MKTSFCDSARFAAATLGRAAVLCFIAAPSAHAVTSPYVTSQSNVPLNQATDDTVNGVLPYFVSHETIEGPVSRLTDAVSPDAPGDNVILGPDNTWVGVAWDFGEPPPGFVWRLERFDAWTVGGDNLRKGYRADISVSLTGEIDDFDVVPNSLHWEAMANSQYNHIRYDFPTEFIAGATAAQDRYPVMGFRYLRFNSLGDRISNTDWQSRFVEIDIWVALAPSPSNPPTINYNLYNPTNGIIHFNWSAILGRTYAVEYKSNLSDTGWTHLETIYARSVRPTFTDDTTAVQRYYRVALQP
jgi:hypothetical protein